MSKFKVGDEVIIRVRTKVMKVIDGNRYVFHFCGTDMTLSGDDVEKTSIGLEKVQK